MHCSSRAFGRASFVTHSRRAFARSAGGDALSALSSGLFKKLRVIFSH